MTTHLITDPAAGGTAVFPAAPGWLTLSAAITAEVPMIADRDDLLVTIAPGAGHGAPACFLPTRALIEVDGTHLGGVDPATAAPHLIGDRRRYATAWGLLTHECAHAAHSRWDPPADAPPGAVAAAKLLEESRIEAAHIRRRPDDRHWLRASATNLVLAELRTTKPGHEPTMSAPDAACAAALLLGRTDGGILTPVETARVAREVDVVLGADTMGKLREVWCEAFTVADDDATAMIELGRRWCEIVGTDPDTDTDDAATGGEDPTAPPSPLARSITAALDEVAQSVPRESIPVGPADRALEAAAAQRATEKTVANAARRVFNKKSGDTGTGKIEITTRRPTDAERTAVRVLARALNTAGVRDRVTTKTTSATPPGRLRMRGALSADAQRAAGAIPTAEPFIRTTRATVPTPPLRLGIACDVSGSMGHFTAPVASAAWILAHAAHRARVSADTATVIFGRHVQPITHPGAAPDMVTDFTAPDDHEAIGTAIDALDGALDLSRPSAARLLIIVSDGWYQPGSRRHGQRAADRLRATGCGVLWLATGRHNTPLNGVTVHVMEDPTTTAQAIGRAATTALRAAR